MSISSTGRARLHEKSAGLSTMPFENGLSSTPPEMEISSNESALCNVCGAEW